MVLAIAKNWNTLYNNKVIRFIFKTSVEHFSDFVVCITHTLKYFFVHTSNTVWSTFKSFTLWVITYCFNKQANSLHNFISVKMCIISIQLFLNFVTAIFNHN